MSEEPSGWDRFPIPRIEGERHTCSAAGEVYAIERPLRVQHDIDDMVEVMYGSAFHGIVKSAGYWWATNDEYSAMIRHCPWCGVKLK